MMLGMNLFRRNFPRVLLCFYVILSVNQLHSQGGDLDIRQYIIDHQELPDKQLEQKVTELMESTGEEDDGIRAIGMAMVHAPDSSFTIFNILWEGCGAYCNPWSEVIVRFNHEEEAFYTQIVDDSDWGVQNADSVFLLNEDLGLYLICSSSWGRPRGIEGVSTMQFNLVRVMANSFDVHWSHTASESNLAYEGEEDELEYLAQYNASDSTISYHSAGYEEGEPWVYTRESGIFQYDQDTDTFVEKAHTTRWWTEKEDRR
jgi:hypothetical protein